MPPKGAEHSVMELATHPSVYLSVSLPPSFYPLCMEFLLHPGLFYEDKTCRGEGSRSGAQLGETVGSGSRWRKRFRGSHTTLQAETEITTTLCNPE